jgi:phospholipid/cholesterol/gamma-HCH transport system ATP-binding protein
MEGKPELEFHNVSLRFGENVALNNVSFKLDKGEMIVLTGVSGSGKSVLLHLAMALLKPDQGQIFVRGTEIENLDESELLAIRGGQMGMVFQEESLFTGLTVYHNVAYRLEEHGWSDEKVQPAVEEVLRFVGLEGEEEKFPEELSGGMKRRVEIARAMIGWPSIMFFDEPTMSLDPIVALQVMDLILRARDVNQVSSIYVSKKPHEFPYLANYRFDESSGTTIETPPGERSNTRVMVLDEGRIIFSGSVEEFQKSNHPGIKKLIALDHHDHSRDPYFPNPWDKGRKPSEEIL